MQRLFKGILALVFCLTLIFPMAAPKNTTAAVSQKNVGSINISSQSHITVTDLMMLDSDNNKSVVTFNIEFTNNSSADLNFLDYWLKLRTKNGARYTLHQLNKDKVSDTISANTKQIYNLYAILPSTVKASDLVIELVEWDFNRPNNDYEHIIGTISVPNNYSYIIPVSETKRVSAESGIIDMKVSEFSLSEHADTMEAIITFSIANQGSRSVKVPNYNYYLVSEEGLYYQLQSNKSDELLIQPLGTKEVELIGEIPLIEEGQWELIISYNMESMELPVAHFKVPEKSIVSENVVLSGQVFTIKLQQGNATTYVENIVKTNNVFSVYFYIKNDGLSSIKVPEYQYALVNDQGLNYPMQIASGSGELTLEPQGSQQITLNSTLPENISSEGLKLLVSEKDESGNATKMIATYELPGQSYAISKYTYNNKHGNYELILNGIQRLPIGNEDMIVADLKIQNTGNTTVPLIDLAGYFIIDGLKQGEGTTQFNKLDNIINLQPGSTINVIMHTKIPYTYSFNALSIILQEKEAESSFKNITEFRTSARTFGMKKIQNKATWNIENIGHRASIMAKASHTYQNMFSVIKYTELEMTNNEKRYSDLIELVAYYKTEDDVYFPATISEVKDKIVPSGKVLLGVWSKLPNTFADTNLELIIGEKLPESTDGSFYKAVDMFIPRESKEIGKLGSIVIEPYTVELSNINATVLSSERVLKLNYNLTRSNYYSVTPEDHTLIIEIIDQDDDLKFEKQVVLNDASGMQLGKGSLELTQAFENVKRDHGVYIMNVYVQFEGHKKLLASDQLSWGKVEYYKYQ